MIVDPADALGGNLAFIPQLYDVWERQVIRELLPVGGTFVDVGSNIGVYSLWAAQKVGPRGKVLAFEAEPANYERLRENIVLNGLEQVQPHCIGVSDKKEKLQLHLNPNGNAGGHTFTAGVHPTGSTVVEIECDRLERLLKDANVASVDFMKMDIEGFEQKVLSRFFEDVPVESPLRPRFILTEMFFGNLKGAGSLWDTIVSNGYQVEREGKTNSLFKRIAT